MSSNAWVAIEYRDETRPRRSADAAGNRDAVLRCLTDWRRRRILDVLFERSEPVEEREVAEAVAEIAGGDVYSHRATLRHVHLPRLSEAGLIEWTDDEGAVALADHPALSDPVVQRIVETDADLDDVVDCLADERRRLVLATLVGHDGAVSRDALAHEVVDREAAPAPAGATEDVDLSLRHTHLPKLEAAGLVEVDGDAVRSEGVPEPLDAWFER